jgi:hypothetical protein
MMPCKIDVGWDGTRGEGSGREREGKWCGRLQ